MIGSEIVATGLAMALPQIQSVHDTVGDRIYGIDVVPQGEQLPAVIHSPVSSSFGAAVGAGANTEIVQYQVRLVCEGQSTDPIWDATEAQLAALDGAHFDLVVKGHQYSLDLEAVGETVPTTAYVGGTYYRILGTIYNVHVVRTS